MVTFKRNFMEFSEELNIVNLRLLHSEYAFDYFSKIYKLLLYENRLSTFTNKVGYYTSDIRTV